MIIKAGHVTATIDNGLDETDINFAKFMINACSCGIGNKLIQVNLLTTILCGHTIEEIVQDDNKCGEYNASKVVKVARKFIDSMKILVDPNDDDALVKPADLNELLNNIQNNLKGDVDDG